MTELARVRLRTLGWFLAFPVVFLGVIPWWLTSHLDGPIIWHGNARQWVGLWLLLNGSALAGWCVNLFNVQGRGTPLPLDPPKRFVASGPYRVVRNPMMLGLFLLLGGQAVLYGSRPVFLYLVSVMVLAHLFLVLVEEPQLKRRFGASYEAYRRQVPRWIPRLPVGSGEGRRRTISGAPPSKRG